MTDLLDKPFCMEDLFIEFACLSLAVITYHNCQNDVFEIFTQMRLARVCFSRNYICAVSTDIVQQRNSSTTSSNHDSR